MANPTESSPVPPGKTFPPPHEMQACPAVTKSAAEQRQLTETSVVSTSRM